jgi:hypothetical protein
VLRAFQRNRQLRREQQLVAEQLKRFKQHLATKAPATKAKAVATKAVGSKQRGRK